MVCLRYAMTVQKELTYPFAKTSNNEIVSASSANKNSDYFCLGCNEALQLRAGPKKGPYFAHKSQQSFCTNETVLHSTAKLLIKTSLENRLKNSENYCFSWKCQECFKEHTGDLLKKKPDIYLEKECFCVRPDISLFLENKPNIVIEVVVSHSPEQQTIDILRNNNVFLMIVKPSWDTIHFFESSLGNVDFLNGPCKSPRCPNCNNLIDLFEIGVFDGYCCYKCKNEMKILVVADFCAENWRAVEDDSLIKTARDNDILLQKTYSGTRGNKYPMHICKKCNAKQGNHFINNFIMLKGFPAEVNNIGEIIQCPKCPYNKINLA